MKAILITEDNRIMLSDRYQAEIDEFEPGLYLIAEFGDDGSFRYQGQLTRENLDLNFTQGAVLDNGFFEIKRRV
jgi:hypothetical protein